MHKFAVRFTGYLAKSSSEIVEAPFENSPNSMCRTSAWRLFMKVQN